MAALNTCLQDALNSQWGGLDELEVGGRILREGNRASLSARPTRAACDRQVWTP